MDRSVGWRAALLQAGLVAAVAVALAVALPRSFFEAWGWLAGLPMLIGVAVGVHWLGSPLALAVFGAWCGWLAARRPGLPVTA